jgi:thioredoxin reductase
MSAWDAIVIGGGHNGLVAGAYLARAGARTVVLARVVGLAALALAVAVIWAPALAPGLHGSGQMMAMAGP